MDLIDSKYINLVSARLDKFKRVKPNLYNFRCPLCGDSQKHKNKARGYFYQVKTNTNYKCHNCGASMSFNNFLKKCFFSEGNQLRPHLCVKIFLTEIERLKNCPYNK